MLEQTKKMDQQAVGRFGVVLLQPSFTVSFIGQDLLFGVLCASNISDKHQKQQWTECGWISLSAILSTTDCQPEILPVAP
jgi:hypothetical protein